MPKLDDRRADSTQTPDPRGGLLPPIDVAFLVAPVGAEEVELVAPWRALLDAGARPRLISTVPGTVQTFDGLDRADVFRVDHPIDGLDSSAFGALVLPGGVANPDCLRRHPGALALVREFFERGLPVATICHAPWTLIDAGVVSGRDITSWPSLATDLTNAGAHWRNEEVVVCRNGPNTLVSSRKPADLPAFCARLVDVLRREYAARS